MPNWGLKLREIKLFLLWLLTRQITVWYLRDCLGKIKVLNCWGNTKNSKSSDLDFFIQATGLAYHHRAKCGVYHQQQQSRCCISSRISVYFPVAWWYTTFRVDDIQCFVLMIYTPSAWFYDEFCWCPWFRGLFVFLGVKNNPLSPLHLFPDLLDLNQRIFEHLKCSNIRN